MKFSADSTLNKQVENFNEAVQKLNMKPPLSNLFFVEAMADEPVSIFKSMHGNEFERWTLTELIEKALPLIANARRQPNAAAGRSNGKEHAGPSSNGKKKNGTVNFAALLSRLDPVQSLDGTTYKPKDVAALKASYKDSNANPDAPKLKLFLDKHNLCYICRDEGHMTRNCPMKKSSGGAAQN